MIPFKKYILLEALVTHDDEFWEQIRSRWLSSVDRAMTGAIDEDKKITDDPKKHPDYIVTGPEIQFEFYEFSDHVVYVERRLGGYNDSYYTLLEYDIVTVKDWWEENWDQPDMAMAGEPDDLYHLNPPDPADMWKHQGEEKDVDEIVTDLTNAIRECDPAGDVRELYRDALDAGAQAIEIEIILQWGLENEYLTKEEIEMIKEEPPGLEEFL